MTSRLTYKQQSALVVDLKKGLRNPQTADDTQTLLKKLRKRDDLFAAIAEDIDELFEGLREMSPDRGAPPKIEKSLAVAEKGVASSEQSNQEEYKVAQLKNYLEIGRICRTLGEESSILPTETRLRRPRP